MAGTMLKKFFAVTLALSMTTGLMSVTALAAEESGTAWEIGPALSETELNFKVGDQARQLSVSNLPDEMTVTWISDNNAVAGVDANGVVTPVGIGTATITAILNAVEPSVLMTIAPPAETQPVTETQPVEVQPAETQPAETQPAETQPAETQPAETQPAETQPVEVQPAETQPAETQPAETQPAETQPAETASKTISSTVNSSVPLTCTVTVSAADVPAIPAETCTVDYRPQSSSVEYAGYTGNSKDGYVFTYKIKAGAEGDQVIELSKGILDLWEKETQMPGGSYKFQYQIINESGNSFTYQPNSFVLAPVDTSTVGSLEDGSLLPVLTYDGQYLPIRYSGAMIPKYFLDILPASSTNAVTFEMLCNIYSYLNKAGYTGDTAMSDYLLDYFNRVNHTSFGSLYELADSDLGWIDGVAVTSNGIFTMTEEQLIAEIEKHPWINQFLYVKTIGSKLQVQIKWPESAMAAASYNSFYKTLFSFAYGAESVAQLNPNGAGVQFTRAHAVGDYLNGTDLYQQTDSFFSGLFSDVLAPDGSVGFSAAYGIDGPGMGNSYQNYSFTAYNAITLRQVTSYTVQANYFTNGVQDNASPVALQAATAAMAGDSVGLTSEQTGSASWATYANNLYSLDAASVVTLKVTPNAADNIITLKYYRTVTVPGTDPGTNPGSDSEGGYLPGKTPSVVIPDTNTPTTEIPDGDTPLTEMPEEPTPLADVPKTGDNQLAFISAVAAAVSLAGLAYGVLREKKREEL